MTRKSDAAGIFAYTARGLHRPLMPAPLKLGLSLLGLSLLAACGGGESLQPAPTGTEITTAGIEGYVTNHNGYTRARIQQATSVADQGVLVQFEDADPSDPAGYRNLISLAEQRYLDNMQLEVIAEVETTVGGETVKRILRMTADQGPFDNLDDKNNLIASGKYYFRGSAQVYAVVDGGALQVGVGTLDNMVVDFDSQSVYINLRTPYDPTNGSDIETTMEVDNIPLNVVTGTFGGDVTLSTRSGTTGEELEATGVLRGNLNGDSDGLSRLVENMTTSGLFTVGTDGDRFTADGIFWGSQLNYAD